MSSANYKALKLLKLVDNRFCADCGAPLGDASQCFASLSFHVWICGECAQVHHVSLISIDSRVKNVRDEWLESEVCAMEAAVSNIAVNKVLEKYVPAGWKRIDAKSDLTERKTWIRAKYFSMYFTLPQCHDVSFSPISKQRKSFTGYSAPKSSSSTREERIATDKSLPPRMVDYFMTVGLGKSPVVLSGGGSPSMRPAGLSDVEQLQFQPVITNCYPAANHYADTPIPDLMGPIVFPGGLRLSRAERPPFCFTFVMTNINRVKLFGAALVVYELLDPDALRAVLSRSQLSGAPSANQHGVYYAPKALTVISHFGFFHLFARFLEQLYRVSLSASAIPLERYISNFVLELPLPPQGRTEVFYALPQSLLQISRPPRNHLPMVDFSFRPLFVSLSVESVLAVFSCLCAEMTVCVCASNIALLTPVQEALLALLFPFVWQGCYVPVLPAHMIELLDAPVPLLVGVHDSYLLETPEDRRPRTVMFVHLDTDTIHFGQGDDFFGPRVIPQLPKQAAAKLRKKLVEHGEVVYRSPAELVQLRSAGFPFPHSEHLTPIESFIAEAGVTTQHQRSVSSSETSSAHSRLGVRRGLATIQEGSGVPYRHPAACTLDNSVSSASSAKGVLDPANNYEEGGAGFNAREVREAFLRFFVKALESYQDYFVSAAAEDGAAGGPAEASRKKTMFRRRETLQSRPGEGALRFDKEAYVQKSDDPFLKQLMETQMFSNYISERLDCPDQAEIRFFDENILAKSNRSKLALLKSSTPFLADEADNLQEAYSVPGPSTAGLDPALQPFTYSHFPSLEEKLVGAVRTPRPLVRQPEIKRMQGQSALLIRTQLLSQAPHRKTSTQSISALCAAAASDGASVCGDSAASVCETVLDGDDDEGELEEVLTDARQRYLDVVAAVTALQSRFRMRPLRQRHRVILRAIKLIERFVRMTSLRRAVQRRIAARRAVQLQKCWRRRLAQRRFRSYLKMVRTLQSAFRGRKARALYRQTLRGVVRIQAACRRFTTRRRQRALLLAMFRAYRLQALCLWEMDHTPLRTRSQYWAGLSSPSYLNAALFRDELLRLYDALHVYAHDSPFFAVKSKTLRFTAKFEQVNSSALVSKLLAGADGVAVSRELELGLTRSVSVLSRDLGAHLSAARSRLAEERQALYLSLKSQDKVAPQLKESLFRLAALPDAKKRKQRLVEGVWTCSAERADSSAQIVLKLVALSATAGEVADCAMARRREKMSAHCVEAVRACLLSIQRNRAGGGRR